MPACCSSQITPGLSTPSRNYGHVHWGHKGTKKAGIKDSFDAGFLCAFVPLCLCVPSIHVRIRANLYLVARRNSETTSPHAREVFFPFANGELITKTRCRMQLDGGLVELFVITFLL